jgi:hypothetical protein
MNALSYFEFNERRTQGSVPYKPDDLIEWPSIVVTESEIDDDTALELSLQEKRVQDHIERVNKIKDRVDEALDAQRVHGGQTLEGFLGK